MSAGFGKDTSIKTKPQQGAPSVPQNCKKEDLFDINFVIKAKSQDKPHEFRCCRKVSVVAFDAVLGQINRNFKQLYLKDINTITEFARAKVQAWIAMFSSSLVVLVTKAGLLRLFGLSVPIMNKQ